MKSRMKFTLAIALGLSACVLAMACRHQPKPVAPRAAEKDTVAIKPASDSVVRSLKELYMRPKGDTIAFCDLSHKGLRVMPDLSRYAIRRLDLSHNALQGRFPAERLPQGLIDLSVAYNKIVTFIFPPTLKRLDVSHNDIHQYYAPHNRLIGGLFAESDDVANLEFLDVSYNWDMPCSLYFDPQDVDTLIHVHAAQNKTLKKQPEYGEEKLGISCRLTVHVPDSLSGGKDTTAGK